MEYADFKKYFEEKDTRDNINLIYSKYFNDSNSIVDKLITLSDNVLSPDFKELSQEDIDYIENILRATLQIQLYSKRSRESLQYTRNIIKLISNIMQSSPERLQLQIDICRILDESYLTISESLVTIRLLVQELSVLSKQGESPNIYSLSRLYYDSYLSYLNNKDKENYTIE